MAGGDPGLTLEMPDGSTREVSSDAIPVDKMRDWIFGVYGGRFPMACRRSKTGRSCCDTTTLPSGRRRCPSPAGATSATTRSGALPPTARRSRSSRPPSSRPGGGPRGAGRGRSPQQRRRQHDVPDVSRCAGDHRGRPSRQRAAHHRPSHLLGRRDLVTDLKVGPRGPGCRARRRAPGGGLNICGDVEVVTLPASKIVVLIAGVYHQRARGDDRLQIEPDIPVELTWADYAAGRDRPRGCPRA